MIDRFVIEDVSIVFGSCDHTAAFLMAWWTGSHIERQAQEVLLPANVVARGSRQNMLELSVCGGLEPGLPTVSWSQFRHEAFSNHPRLVVVGSATGSDDDPLDVAVALQVSRQSEGGVDVERADYDAWIAPLPRVPDAIETLLAIALSAACCRHAVKPGRRVPEIWTGPRRARIGEWRLTSDAAALPLAMRRPKIHTFTGHDHEDLRQAIAEGRPAGDEPLRLTVVSRDEELERRLSETRSMLAAGRTFSRSIHLARALESTRAELVFSGLSSSYTGVGHDWLVAVPAWRDGAPDPSHDEVMTRVRQTYWWQQRAVELMRLAQFEFEGFRGVSIGAVFGDWALNSPERFQELESSSLFRRELAGDYAAPREYWANQGHVEAATNDAIIWQCWAVVGPLETVHEVVDSSDLVYITEVRSDHECVVCGLPGALDEVLAALLDSPKIQVEELECREVLHCEPASPAIDAVGDAMEHAFVSQVAKTLDLRPLWRDAWEQGTRVFVETGPRCLAAHWIEREIDDAGAHLSVSLDRRLGWGPLEIYDFAARLWAHGIRFDIEAIEGLLTFDERPMRLHALSDVEDSHLRWVDAPSVADRFAETQREATEAHLSYIEAQSSAFESLLDAQLKSFTELLDLHNPEA